MLDALLDALVDTGKLLPILFLTYLLMEYLEHHAGGRLGRCLQRSRGAGPALGAALGLVPQCGFSGAASSLYAAGTITMGTLLAVFLSTSDEMLPILLSSQVPLATVGTILGLKFLAGAAVGFGVDGVLRLRRSQREPDIHGFCQQEHCSCEGGDLPFRPSAYGEDCCINFRGNAHSESGVFVAAPPEVAGVMEYPSAGGVGGSDPGSLPPTVPLRSF